MAKVQKMERTKVGPLSAAILAAFFSGKDAEQASAKVAAVEQPRLQYLFGFFPQSDLSDVQTAVKEMRQQAKAEHGDESSQYKTAKVRAAEVTTLYGAYRFADLKEPVGGYKATVEAARAALKAKRIKPNGQAIPEKWERDVQREAGIKAAEWEAAEMARRKAEQKGEKFTDADAQAEMERTRNAIERQGANDMAATLFKRKGATFCGWLIEALEGNIAAAAKAQEPEQAPKTGTNG